MYKIIAVAVMVLANNVQAQSSIIAIHEETPNGLVRVDQPQQQNNPQRVPKYQPQQVNTNTPQYKVFTVLMFDCNCYRNIKVRIN